MTKLFVTDKSNETSKKCGGCNCQADTFYGIGTSKRSARNDFKGINPKNYGLGLCPACMIELLVEEKYEIR